MKARRTQGRRALSVAAPLAGALLLGGALRSEAEAQPPPVLSSVPLFGNAMVSGFVLDALSGRPVKSATITPEPDLGVTQANQQGLYVLDASYSYGVLTLRGSAPGFRQVRSACVLLRPGTNGFGDIPLIRADTQPSDTCSPGCAEGEQCLGGVCASACDPVCPCNQICSGGACVDNPDLPPADSCGDNSRPLGSGVCGCNPGFVPNANGVACVEPIANQACPQGANSTAFGCVCSDGAIYSEEEDACLPPDEAAIVSPIGSGVITRSWRTPGKRPAGVAFDGTKHWITDNATQMLYSLTLTPGAPDAEVLSSFPLGEPGLRVIDVDALGGKVFMLVEPPGPTETGGDLLRFDPETSQLTSLNPPEFETISAIASDGSELYSLNAYRGMQTRDQSGQIAAPQRQAGTIVFSPKLIFDLATRPQQVAGVRYGAFTLNQFVLYHGTSYDTNTFTAHFEVSNAVNKRLAKPLPPATIDIPAPYVRGFDAYGSTGWIVVHGITIDHPIIGEVQFGAE